MGSFLSDIKCICYDTMQYGPSVSLSRYKYDRSKAQGIMDADALRQMHKSILRYLKKHYNGLIEKYNKIDTLTEGYTTSERNTIWCFWWQGIENAPEIVKVCVETIHRANPSCKIIVINENNFSDYVDIPEYIIAGVRNGDISFTHFSDILRFNLLKKYGGVWVDSTIYCVNKFPEGYLSASLFTPKSTPALSECVADYRWACYLMGGNAEHILFNFIVDFYNLYFKEHRSVLHYFLIDYCIELAYENIPTIKKALDGIPTNNEMRVFLTKHLCDSYTSDYSLQELSKKADFYKLFWKQEYYDFDKNGELTVWGFLKNEIYGERLT